MKNIKSLILSLALVCLLATAALAGDGTMTSGGDRTPPPPPPPPAEITAQADLLPEAEPGDAETAAVFAAARDALAGIGLWVVWL